MIYCSKRGATRIGLQYTVRQWGVKHCKEQKTTSPGCRYDVLWNTMEYHGLVIVDRISINGNVPTNSK